MVSAPLPVPWALRPTETHGVNRATFGLGPDQARVAGTVGLAERVAAGDERNGLLVVHRHPGEGLADVVGRGSRVGHAAGSFRIHVDQAHGDVAVRRVAQVERTVVDVTLVAEPRVLRPPEDLLRFPDVVATEPEAERLEAHVLEGDVAGEHEQVGPGDLLAVLLLDRPQQAASLVEVGVVRPAVERGEALRAVAAAAAAVGDAVRPGLVPGHADEQRPVVPVVRRPPVLRGVHHLDDVALQRVEVEPLELRGVVEALTQRVARAASAGAAPRGRSGRATSPGCGEASPRASARVLRSRGSRSRSCSPWALRPLSPPSIVMGQDCGRYFATRL